MKSLLLLWNSIAVDMAVRCCTSAHHDRKTVEERSKNEGLSFLTITLPGFAKDFEYCLEQGFVDDTVFLSFKKNGRLPAFLSGFSHLVFDRRTGALLDKPSIDAIRAIRQLTLLYSKILIDCKPSRVSKAFKEFVDCEQEVREKTGSRTYLEFDRLSTLLFGSAFSKMDLRIYQGDFRPKHGPGSTADSLIGNQKFDQKVWPSRLESYFPYVENVLPNLSWWEESLKVDFLEPGSEIPVKVVSVPKTMKTPRIIAIEPTAMQYAQQALLGVFRDVVEDCFLNDFIGMEHQTPNQRLAQHGSLYGDLATIDLSEASDRVSHEIVSRLLSRHRHLHDAVMSCRSSTALLPSGSILTLAKFASMGSALCFPMEAAVFLTAVFVGIEQSLGHRLTKRDILAMRGQVRIYGDDIIVPVEHVRFVCRSLEYFGLKVNDRKSFWNGKFRESCGKEYYDGSDVSVVRCRRIIPSTRKNVQEVVSAVSLRNQLFQAGAENAVRYLDSGLLRILRVFPYIEEDSPVLGRLHDGSFTSKIIMVNSIPKVKGWIIRPVIPEHEISGWPALRKCLQLMELRPWNTDPFNYVSSSKDHLRRSGRPRVVDIKLGMGPPA